MLVLKWRQPVRLGVASSPVSWAGFVYVGGINDTVYALNGQTGAVVWKFAAASWISAAPAVAGGTVYVPSVDHSIHAIWANTGLRRWAHASESWMESSPIVVDNTVYVGSSDHYLYSLNARTGARNWRFQTSGDVIASPGYSDGMIYLASDDDTLYALTPTRQLVWKHGVNGAIYTAPAVSEGLVVFGVVDNGVATPDSQGDFYSYNNKVVALDAATGAPRWEYITEPWGFVYSSPATEGGRVYFGTQQGYVRARRLSDGAAVWERRINDQAILGSPAVADGILYVPSYDGNLYMLSAADGSILGQYATGALIHSSPAVANGKLYFGGADGYLYCLDIVNGVTATLVPASAQVRRGGTLRYTARLFNETSISQTLQYWADLTLPTGSPYSRNPVFGPSSVTLLPNETKNLEISHRVPAGAALGKYIYTGKSGTHSLSVNDQDSFIFEVTN
jgi:outer membrane protein assembly factor BamB